MRAVAPAILLLFSLCTSLVAQPMEPLDGWGVVGVYPPVTNGLNPINGSPVNVDQLLTASIIGLKAQFGLPWSIDTDIDDGVVCVLDTVTNEKTEFFFFWDPSETFAGLAHPGGERKLAVNFSDWVFPSGIGADFNTELWATWIHELAHIEISEYHAGLCANDPDPDCQALLDALLDCHESLGALLGGADACHEAAAAAAAARDLCQASCQWPEGSDEREALQEAAQGEIDDSRSQQITCGAISVVCGPMPMPPGPPAMGPLPPGWGHEGGCPICPN